MKIQPVSWLLNSNAVWNFYWKIGNISDMDWTHQIKMDYAQNLWKDPVIAKKDHTGYLSKEYSF